MANVNVKHHISLPGCSFLRPIVGLLRAPARSPANKPAVHPSRNHSAICDRDTSSVRAARAWSSQPMSLETSLRASTRDSQREPRFEVAQFRMPRNSLFQNAGRPGSSMKLRVSTKASSKISYLKIPRKLRNKALVLEAWNSTEETQFVLVRICCRADHRAAEQASDQLKVSRVTRLKSYRSRLHP